MSSVGAELLPAPDQQFLDRILPEPTVTSEGGVVCVVIPDLTLPAGFTAKLSDLLVRLGPGYPDIGPDMWWFSPPVLRSDGAPIPATEVREVVLGREWQRWSRHFDAGVWLAGVDTLESYVALVYSEVGRSAQ